ncbi:hypothetical protein TMatcc_010359 [Talaromyces marneffei ATCC 18224]|nr:hypothetical protein EYB25_009171 [Talaromyces marneffei]
MSSTFRSVKEFNSFFFFSVKSLRPHGDLMPAANDVTRFNSGFLLLLLVNNYYSDPSALLNDDKKDQKKYFIGENLVPAFESSELSGFVIEEKTHPL